MLSPSRVGRGARGEGEIFVTGIGPDYVGYRTNLTRIHCGTGADVDNTPDAEIWDGPALVGYRIYRSPVRTRPYPRGCVAQHGRAIGFRPHSHARPAREGTEFFGGSSMGRAGDC